MKKKLLVLLSFAAVLLTGCNNNSKTIEINPDTWTSKEGASVESVYNQQIEESQYIKDLENFLSYNILLLTEDKPFVSDTSVTAKFDSQSSVQGELGFSQNKYSKSHDLEDMEIAFDVKAEGAQDDLEPFYASGSLSLVYQNNELYANIHDFGVYMGEGDMLAKMYTLLGESLIDQWVDLEAHSGGIVTLNEKEDIKLQYIVGTLKNVLKSEWINEDSPNFLNGIAELIDTVNSHIDLGISTNGLSLVSKGTRYYQLSDGLIERMFTGAFHGEESEFNIDITSNKKGIEVRLYDVKKFNEEAQSYIPTNIELQFSLKENNKSDYLIKLKALNSGEVVATIDGNLKYNNQVDFVGNFMVDNTLELNQGQRISGNIEGKIIKQSPKGDEIFNEVSGETISLSSILSSLL